jgi:rRNA maturation RNase YbeY
VPVTFHTDKTKFSLRQKSLHKRWINSWVESRNATCGTISIIFTSNSNLRLINRDYLNHNYYTDVITFDFSEGSSISGDIFISIDQVRINAKEYSTEPGDELRRVMIHGVNHLLGFKDGTDEEKSTMRQMENEALHLWLKMV